MRRSMLAWCVALALAACGTGGDDAGDDPGADASGEVCTGAVYDACVDTEGASDCGEDLQCHVFAQAGLTVCVPACSESAPCPDQDGVAVRCNNMGRCRPDVANDCALP
jgi:hypothetical protein